VLQCNVVTQNYIMAVWIDVKYLKQISYRLDRWIEKKISPHQSICKCPICGDSLKKANKKRGYFYEKGASILFRCFNCDASMSFGKFLREFDPFVYKQYAMESYKERVQDTPKPLKEEISPLLGSKKSTQIALKQAQTESNSVLGDAVPLMTLDSKHPARLYYDARKLPSKYNSMFYFAENFFSWASKNTDKFEAAEENCKDHPRIIIPWYNGKQELFAYQARSIFGQEPKYYTIVLDTETPKFFGVDRVDLSKKIYCCEGLFDSLFLDNSLAVGSSALTTFSDKNLDVVYVWDNEKRNLEICKLMKKAILANKQVVIWPNNLIQKDINDMVLSELDVKSIIKENTFCGIRAKLRFSNWNKCL